MRREEMETLGCHVHCEENLDQGGQSNTSPHTSSRSSPQPLAADSIGNLPYVELLLQHKLANTSKFPIHGLVDSGSQSNICQGQYLKHLNIDFQRDIKPCRVTIQTPSQSHANICLGTITLNVYFRK